MPSYILRNIDPELWKAVKAGRQAAALRRLLGDSYDELLNAERL